MKTALAALSLGCAAMIGACATTDPVAARSAATPQAVVEELLAADRAFAAAAAGTDAVSGISAMFDEQVMMPLPSGQFGRTKAEAVAALRSNPANVDAKVEWAPIRGGISADGRHGFTFGYMTIAEEGKPARLAKYLSYWVRRPEGWRIAAYKRGRRAEGEVSMEMMEPSLPKRLARTSADPERLAAYERSLAATEQSFSDEAQKIGIGPAFAKYGRADSVNMGPGPTFDVGAETIARNVGGDAPGSPVRWSPEAGVLVASSGDLGITFGFIRSNGPPAAGQPAAIPFSTVWRRDSPGEPWRYIAE